MVGGGGGTGTLQLDAEIVGFVGHYQVIVKARKDNHDNCRIVCLHIFVPGCVGEFGVL